MMLRNKRINSLLAHSMWNVPAAYLVNRSSANNKKSKNQATYIVPSLEVIDRMVSLVSEDIRGEFKKTILVCCQHNLETTLTIYQAMKALGIRKIYSVGKCYSDSEVIIEAMLEHGICLMPSNKPIKPGEFQEACRQDIRAMWKRCIKELEENIEEDIETIIVLDDGGRCLEEMPGYMRLNYRVAGIEQTRGGLYSPVLKELPFPVIEVASSAVKREIEPVFIVKAIIKELEAKIPSIVNIFKFNQKTVMGVIGNGAIGSAVAQYFLSAGYIVAVYDESEDTFANVTPKSRLYRMPSLEALISNSQCIFGCTGKDALRDLPLLEMVRQDTVFVSCTSEDREFLSTLQAISGKSIVMSNPLEDIVCLSKNGSKVVFMRGGYPFNFNGKPCNVPANEIEPTQGALLGAVIQAVVCAKKPAGNGVTINYAERLMLDPHIQRFVVETWRDTPAAAQHSVELLNCFNQLEWIQKNSGGKHSPKDLIEQCFLLPPQEQKDQLIAQSAQEGGPSLAIPPLKSRL